MPQVYDAPNTYFEEIEQYPTEITPVPTSVPTFFGVAEWGPEWTPQAIYNGFGNWMKMFGDHVDYSDLPFCVDHFHKEAQATGLAAGRLTYTVRQTKLNDDLSDVADDVVKASTNLTSITSLPRGALLIGTQSPSDYLNGWAIPHDQQILLKFTVSEGYGDETTYEATIVGYSAVLQTAILSGNFTAVETRPYFEMRIAAGQNPLPVYLEHLTYTPAQLVDAINSQIAKASAALDSGRIVITHDAGGTQSYLEVVSATSDIASYFGWTLGALPSSGPASLGSNVANTLNVTIAELKTIIEAIVGAPVTVSTTLTPLKFNMVTVATGAEITLQFDDSEDTAYARQIFGIPTTEFIGADAGTAASALLAEAKYYGLRGNRLSVKPVLNSKRSSRLAASVSTPDLKTAITAGAEYFDVDSRFGYEENMVLRLFDSVNEEWVVLNRIESMFDDEGDAYYRLHITSDNTVTGAFQYAFAVGMTQVDSMEFDFYVYVDGILKESFIQLSVNDIANNYFETVIEDEYAGSQLVVLQPAAGVAEYLKTLFPATLTAAVRLTGATLETESDYSISNRDFEGSIQNLTGMYAVHKMRFKTSLIATPNANAVKIKKMQIYLNRRKDMFHVASVPESDVGFVSIDSAASAFGWRDRNGFDSMFLGLYYPREVVEDPIGTGRDPLRTIDPVGGILGVYARVHAMEPPDGGVWGAAAGEGDFGRLYFARDLADEIDEIGDGTGRGSELGTLNSAGVNCILKLNTGTINIWGAKTTSSNEKWLYIPVRLTGTMLEQSVLLGTRYGVFRGNTPRWWELLKDSVGGLLEQTWRDGGLQGTTQAQAYYVKMGTTDGTMTQDDINKGREIGEFGYAPVKPSEFIVWRVNQLPGGETELS